MPTVSCARCRLRFYASSATDGDVMCPSCALLIERDAQIHACLAGGRLPAIELLNEQVAAIEEEGRRFQSELTALVQACAGVEGFAVVAAHVDVDHVLAALLGERDGDWYRSAIERDGVESVAEAEVLYWIGSGRLEASFEAADRVVMEVWERARFTEPRVLSVSARAVAAFMRKAGWCEPPQLGLFDPPDRVSTYRIGF